MAISRYVHKVRTNGEGVVPRRHPRITAVPERGSGRARKVRGGQWSVALSSQLGLSVGAVYQAAAVIVGQVVPRPVDEHVETIAEANKVNQVQSEPGQPTNWAR